MVLLYTTNIITYEEAFSGFSNSGDSFILSWNIYIYIYICMRVCVMFIIRGVVALGCGMLTQISLARCGVSGQCEYGSSCTGGGQCLQVAIVVKVVVTYGLACVLGCQCREGFQCLKLCQRCKCSVARSSAKTVTWYSGWTVSSCASPQILLQVCSPAAQINHCCAFPSPSMCWPDVFIPQ